MRCDRCNGETKQKEITSKKSGEKYTVFECIEGCKNPDNNRFAYSFFAPRPRREGKSQPVRQPQQAPAVANINAISLLKEIVTSLHNILEILQTKSQMVPVQKRELEPDEEIPF